MVILIKNYNRLNYEYQDLSQILSKKSTLHSSFLKVNSGIVNYIRFCSNHSGCILEKREHRQPELCRWVSSLFKYLI